LESDGELNRRADKLLAEYAREYPQLQSSSRLQQAQDINMAVDAFKACVQSLMALEIPIELIEPPPLYEHRLQDKIILDMDGRVGRVVNA
jgi:hypothetical protein